jgi:hypothetical protein
MPIIKELVDSVYGADVVLFVGSRQRLLSWLRSEYRCPAKQTARDIPNDSMARVLIVDVEADDPPRALASMFVLWLAKWEDTPGMHSTLAHEAYHLACHVLEHHGVNTTEQEAVAYYLDSVVEQCTRALMETTPKKRTRSA